MGARVLTMVELPPFSSLESGFDGVCWPVPPKDRFPQNLPKRPHLAGWLFISL